MLRRFSWSTGSQVVVASGMGTLKEDGNGGLERLSSGIEDPRPRICGDRDVRAWVTDFPVSALRSHISLPPATLSQDVRVQKPRDGVGPALGLLRAHVLGD